MRTVPLHGAKAAGRVTLVDDGDYELVMQYRWHVQERKIENKRPIGPYAVTNLPRSGGRIGAVSMHTLITGWPLVDHQDHDGLNNQRSNLRPATNAQNNQNRRSRLGTTSQYKGVYWHSRDHVWRASIKCQKKTVYLGTFPAEEDAARAYDAAARERFGEYATLNFP